MAQLYKNRTVDDGQYPPPADMRPATPLSGQHGAPAEPTIDPADVRRVAADLEQITALVGSLGPAAHQMADALRSSAAQQGYSDGLTRAQAEVQHQLLEAVAALTEAQTERHRIAEQNEAALGDLAMRIARKVIGAHLQADPTMVARIVAETIAELEPTTSLVVHVNPADLDAVLAERTEIERLVQGNGKVEIVADSNVDLGGCLLVSPVGDVDARLETKLSVLEAAFAAQRRQLIDGGS